MTTPAESPPVLAVILAHPDDESFPMGGTLAKYAAAGARVILICATSGEAGIAGVTPAAAAHIREAELQHAAATLGIATVHLLGYRDGAVSTIPSEQFAAHLAGLLKIIRPQAIITFGPDGISGHPDHVAVHLAVTAAVDQLGDQLGAGVRLFYLAHSEATQQGCGVPVVVQQRDAPVAAINVSDYLVTKVKAVQCHASQDPPFHGPPAEAAAALACHEYFTLARPAISTLATIDDLFAPLGDLLPAELTHTGKDVTIAI